MGCPGVSWVSFVNWRVALPVEEGDTEDEGTNDYTLTHHDSDFRNLGTTAMSFLDGARLGYSIDCFRFIGRRSDSWGILDRNSSGGNGDSEFGILGLG